MQPFYQSYHRQSLPIPSSSSITFLSTTGITRDEQREKTSAIATTVCSNPTQFQSPTLRLATVGASSLHMFLPNRFFPPQTSSPVRSLPLQINAQNDLERRLPPGPPRASAPPDPGQPVAGACPRSPHTSLRRIFSAHPQPRFRHTVRLMAS